MKKLLKSFSFALVLVGLLTLAACGKTNEDLEKAVDALILPDLTRVTSDISLPNKGLNETTITWVSSDDNFVVIEDVMSTPAEDSDEEAEIIGYKAVVTRPGFESEHALLKLTATITHGEDTATKEFNVRVLRDVVPEVGTIEQVKAMRVGTIVETNAVVFAKSGSGFWMFDDTGAMFVFTRTAPTVNIGDEITIRGSFATHFEQPQIADSFYINVESTGNDLPTATVATIADLVENEATDRSIYALTHTVTGTVDARVSGNFTNFFLVDEDDNELRIDHATNNTVFADFDGAEVTVTIVVNSYHSTQQVWYVGFHGTANDITIVTPAPSAE